jgi:hypothetical protein
MTPPFERALIARNAAWIRLCNDFYRSDLIAEGIDSVTGKPVEIPQRDWGNDNLRVDPPANRIFMEDRGRWIEDITVRVANLSEAHRTAPSAPKPRVDWRAVWEHIKTLYSQGRLPEQDFMTVVEAWIRERFSPPANLRQALQRYKTALYRGDIERPTSTNRTARHRRRRR